MLYSLPPRLLATQDDHSENISLKDGARKPRRDVAGC